MRLFLTTIIVALLTLNLSAQTKPPAGGGGTAATCPPAIPITAGEFTVHVRGNECTEDLANADPAIVSKQMPNRRINGADKVTFAAAPTISLVGRGLNYEHAIEGCNKLSNYFTPRFYHLPPQVIGADTVRMTEFDPTKALWTTMQYTVSNPSSEVGVIDWNVTFVPTDPSIYCSDYLALFFASYMPFTTDAKLYFLGKTAAGAPETWIAQTIPYPGKSVMHEADSALPVDPAPASTFGYGVDYKTQLAAFDWPRYTVPMYCAVTTSQNMVYQIMFDTTDVRLTGFRFSVKTSGEGTPAQDWQYVLRNPVAGQQRGLRARVIFRPYQAATFEHDCRAAYAAWVP